MLSSFPKGVSESVFKIWFICGCVATNKPGPCWESVIVGISSLMSSWTHPMPAAVLGRASQKNCCIIVQRKGLSRNISVVRWSRVFQITMEHVEVNYSRILAGTGCLWAGFPSVGWGSSNCLAFVTAFQHHEVARSDWWWLCSLPSVLPSLQGSRADHQVPAPADVLRGGWPHLHCGSEAALGGEGTNPLPQHHSRGFHQVGTWHQSSREPARADRGKLPVPKARLPGIRFSANSSSLNFPFNKTGFHCASSNKIHLHKVILP